MTTNTNSKQLTKEEKLKKIDFLRIIHPDFQKAMELIEMCHKSKFNYSEPQCLLITGGYGTGKSTIMDMYVYQHQKIIPLERNTKVSILSGSIPSPTTIMTFLEAMLNHLGDPFPVKGTIGNKQHRLVKLIIDCDVELLILDEFQHFVHKENQQINHKVADCFKSIINATKVPVVLLGIDESENVLKDNGQLKRRFSFRHHLSGFSCKNPRAIDQFRILLGQIDKNLPFNKPAGLNEHGMWEKFDLVTNGNMNSLMRLIRSAAVFAVEEDQEALTEKNLSKAFEFHSFIMEGPNPFK